MPTQVKRPERREVSPDWRRRLFTSTDACIRDLSKAERSANDGELHAQTRETRIALDQYLWREPESQVLTI
jgi:hypothetical protein